MKINNTPPLYRMISVSDVKLLQAQKKILPQVQQMTSKGNSAASPGEIAKQIQINQSLGTKTVFGQNGILISQKRDAKGNIVETYPPADMIKRAYKIEA